MNLRERELITLITLFSEEVDCLRSVLSEYEGNKDHFVQNVRANILREAIETLLHKV